MDFTYIEEAYIDPRQKNIKTVIEEPVQTPLQAPLQEPLQEILENKQIIDVSLPQNEIIFCKCKKINWFNVIVMLLLLYLVFKK